MLNPKKSKAKILRIICHTYLSKSSCDDLKLKVQHSPKIMHAQSSGTRSSCAARTRKPEPEVKIQFFAFYPQELLKKVRS